MTADPSLTPRERQILTLVSQGMTDRLIAEELGIYPSTVKSHLTSIFRKLGVSNRTRAALWLLRGLDRFAEADLVDD